MHGPVVLHFGPGLGRFVEELERQLLHAREHLHQAAFEGRPETLLLAVLVGTVGQRLLVDDPQPQQALAHFLGDHGRAVIAQQRPGQTAFLDRLGEPMHQILGRLREVPLQMAAQPRVIVEDPQRQRPLPLATRQEHRKRALMEVQMPQGADILGLVAADLSTLASLRRTFLAGTALGRRPPLADPAVSLHISPDRGIRTERPQGRLGLDPGDEVVVVQLVAPVLVVAILGEQVLGLRRGQGDLAAVLTHDPSQDADRIVLRPSGGVVPTLDGRGGELDQAAVHRMRPGLVGQGLEGGLQLSTRHAAHSAANPPRRTESGPRKQKSNKQVFESSQLLRNGVRITVRPP